MPSSIDLLDYRNTNSTHKHSNLILICYQNATLSDQTVQTSLRKISPTYTHLHTPTHTITDCTYLLFTHHCSVFTFFLLMTKSIFPLYIVHSPSSSLHCYILFFIQANTNCPVWQTLNSKLCSTKKVVYYRMYSNKTVFVLLLFAAHYICI